MTMEHSRMHFEEMPGMSRIFLRFRSRCENIQSWSKRQTLVSFEQFIEKRPAKIRFSGIFV